MRERRAFSLFWSVNQCNHGFGGVNSSHEFLMGLSSILFKVCVKYIMNVDLSSEKPLI